MKRTTSNYSIRQVSFTNLCFVVVSKGPPHLTLKPSIFQLVSVFFFVFCWAGILLLLVWFVSLFVSFFVRLRITCFPPIKWVFLLISLCLSRYFCVFLVSPCVPDLLFSLSFFSCSFYLPRVLLLHPFFFPSFLVSLFSIFLIGFKVVLEYLLPGFSLAS